MRDSAWPALTIDPAMHLQIARRPPRRVLEAPLEDVFVPERPELRARSRDPQHGPVEGREVALAALDDRHRDERAARLSERADHLRPGKARGRATQVPCSHERR